ncbi:sigma-70 family RNA polymerase sigma factor [Streptomyces sp. NPDC004647]|uniref:RNA polymerase sigma factor n=1 Tax=Streptomyces sp. NPDC004647 TaxID=3154671 RepID=UPI0033A87546
MHKRDGLSSPPEAVGCRHSGRSPTPTPPPAAGTAAGRDSLTELEDRLLAVRAGEGDDDAFAVLVRRHGASLLALARHLLGNPADAEDAVQDAFLSAWRRLPEFRGDAAFRTWMYRIVTNRCLNTLRRRAPTLPLEAVPEPAARNAGSAPERVAESDAATTALAQALSKLSADQRACWVLRELHGMHYEEIAQVMGTSEQSVRGRLFRARRSLTKEMGPWR